MKENRKKVGKKELDIFKCYNISELFDTNENDNDWFPNSGGEDYLMYLCEWRKKKSTESFKKYVQYLPRQKSGLRLVNLERH